MSSLPVGFPAEKLSEVEKYRVISFYDQFVEDYYDEYKYGHFILAAYASVPAMLTPDLMYKLWTNFNGYTWVKKPTKIHRIAVSDILLSPLVREIGFELFQMEENIRVAFQEWIAFTQMDEIWSKRGLASTQKVSDFILHYQSKVNPGSLLWGNGYDEAQQLMALAGINKKKSTDLFFSKLSKYSKERNDTQVLRLLNLYPKLIEQIKLSGEHLNLEIKEELDNTALVSKAWKALLESNSEYFLKTFQEHPELKEYLDDEPLNGVEVRVSKQIEKNIRKVMDGNVYGFFIGINEYLDDKIPHLDGAKIDAERVAKFIQVNFPSSPPSMILFDKEATKNNIEKFFFEYFSDLKNSDFAVFYFSGHFDIHPNMVGIMPHDGVASEEKTQIKLQTLAKWIHKLISNKMITFLCILDASQCYSIVEELKKNYQWK